MDEGWHEDQYLIMFSGDEIEAATNRYNCQKYLPGYEVVGLAGWDDLLVRDSTGETYSVPAVPLVQERVAKWSFPCTPDALQPDEKFTGKIKWYLTPIVFGGDPEASDNLAWLTHEQHGEAMTWWNEKFLDVKASQTTK
ncbi:MAG: hypothetical protein AAFM91_08635 [Pseudomonadota bacterium]